MVKEGLLESASDPELTESVRQDTGEGLAQIRYPNTRGGTVRKIHGSVHITVLGSRFSARFGSFKVQREWGGVVNFNMHFIYLAEKVNNTLKFWLRT